MLLGTGIFTDTSAELLVWLQVFVRTPAEDLRVVLEFVHDRLSEGRTISKRCDVAY